MLPMFKFPRQLRPGDFVKALGKWWEVLKIDQITEFNTIIEVLDRNGKIVLSNKEKVEIQIPGMLS